MKPATFTSENLPATIEDVDMLEDLLSTPTDALVQDLEKLPGDIMFLGVAGKIGLTMARMAKRAAPGKRIIGVARFSEAGLKEKLESWGIETITCDLLNPESIAALPKVPNLVYMAGKKFGTEEDPSFAWAMNTFVPAMVARELKDSRIVAFSTLCVYPFGPVVSDGWDESVQPQPLGDYANSCVGRERAFQYGSRRYGTKGRLIRLNYAIDMRYGVLLDIAQWVHKEQPIPIATGHASVIWQGDSNAQILRSLLYCESPTAPLNIGGPRPASVRAVAEEFGKAFGKQPRYEGVEQPLAWVNSTLASQRLFGNPVVPLAKMIDWVADWVKRDMPIHNKPTGYEVRDGHF